MEICHMFPKYIFMTQVNHLFSISQGFMSQLKDIKKNWVYLMTGRVKERLIQIGVLGGFLDLTSGFASLWPRKLKNNTDAQALSQIHPFRIWLVGKYPDSCSF